MKTSFYLTAICLIALGTFLVWSKLHINTHDVGIAVHDDNDQYRFTAVFPDGNTYRVQQYINQSISPNSLAKSDNDYFDVTTTLTDRTEFYINESPGNLKIEIDKRKNSNASIYRIRKMCDGIKDMLTGK
jgi:hypothetical protein